MRAAFIKYANNAELPTLAEKLDHMFKTKLLPNACKTKIKSSDEEKNFKLAEKVMDQYTEQLHSVFRYFGRQSSQNILQKDETLSIGDLLNMFRKAKILDTNKISTQDFIAIVEKYHASGDGLKLTEKLSNDNFKAYIQANPNMLKINTEVQEILANNEEIESQKKIGVASEKELIEPLTEDYIKERTAAESAELYEPWVERTIAEHTLFIKGSEIMFFEFKEILFDMARKLKDQVEPKTGKMTVVLQKFIEEWLLRRLLAFVKFEIPPVPVRGKEASRTWPESDKDVAIREKKEQIRLEQEAARAAAAEAERIAAEERAAAQEAEPEIDPAELEEQRRKQAEEEEAARIAREAAEEAALADLESSGSDDASENSEAEDDGDESF